MAEETFTLYDYFKIVKKRKTVFLVPFFVVVILGLWFTLAQPEVFQVSSSFLVDPPTTYDPPQFVTQLLEKARSRELVEETLKVRGLRMDPEVIINNLTVRADAGNNSVLRVTLQGSNKKDITLFLDAHVDVLMAFAKNYAQERITNVVSYISSQTEDITLRLRTIEGEIKQLQESQKLISIPEEMANTLNNEKQGRNDLEQLEFETNNTKLAIDSLRGRLSGTKVGSRSTISGDVVVLLRKELTSLELEAMSLSMVYKEDHPKILEVKDKIAFIRKKVEEESLKGINTSTDENLEVVKVSVGELVRLENQLIFLEARKAMLKQQIDKAEKGFIDLSNNKQKFTDLMREQKVLEQSLASNIDRKNQALIERQGVRSRLSVLGRPYEPSFPVKPNYKMYMLFTLVLAFLTGLGVVSLAEQIDNSVKSTQEIQEMLNLPIRGLIQDLYKCQKYVPQTKDPVDPLLCTHLFPASKEAESFRTLRTNILHQHKENPFQTMMVVSATECVGKSTVTSNLGIIIAQAGYRVIIVDTDLRHPTIHKKFRLENNKGLTNLLTGMPFDEVIQPTCIPRLSILAAGGLPPNPAEILQNDGFQEVINFLKTQADFILFDNPPLNLVTDSLILATKIQRIFYLVGIGHTDKNEIRTSFELLKGLNCNVAGLICNRIPPNEMGGYYYYYVKS